MRASRCCTSWSVGVACVLAFAAPGSPLHGALRMQPAAQLDVPCEAEYERADLPITLPNRNPLEIGNAWMDFRFNRAEQGLTRLDDALKLVAGPWGWRVPADIRKELTSAIAAFRTCIATHQPPALATLTVRTFRFHPDAPAGRGEPGGRGVSIAVDDRTVGTTRDDGTLTVKVPSGQLRVTGTMLPTTAGETTVFLRPDGSGTAEIVLDDGKEPGADSRLDLVEAVNDIIPDTTPSFTLRFVEDGGVVPLADLLDVDVEKRDGGSIDVKDLFAIEDGTIAARSPGALFARLGSLVDDTIVLRVAGSDRRGWSHAGRVGFRVGQSRLAVTLAPPPSNPGLSVSNIRVGISLVGAGIAVERVSDASGRLEVESLPHATIALDCETASGGAHYYGQAMMRHAGDRSVRLVMRHVSDVVNGVPALVDGTAPASGQRPDQALPEHTRELRRMRHDGAIQQLPRSFSADSIARGDSASVTVSSGAAAGPNEGTAAVPVSTGTGEVHLSYEVVTAEYPRYVDPGSAFDDVWTLAVFEETTGERLFFMRGNVTGQAAVHPATGSSRRKGGEIAACRFPLSR